MVTPSWKSRRAPVQEAEGKDATFLPRRFVPAQRQEKDFCQCRELWFRDNNFGQPRFTQDLMFELSTRVEVLRGANLEVRAGRILGGGGAEWIGKKHHCFTLLATLDRPDSGEIYFHGNRIDHLSARHRDRLRNRHFGMVFQLYHLLPELTALENVMLLLMIGQSPFLLLTKWRRFRRQAQRWLEAVGLGHRAHHKPREMSGGEMQRAAIARALVHGPEILFADEPTGNLDRQTGWEILRLTPFLELAAEPHYSHGHPRSSA